MFFDGKVTCNDEIICMSYSSTTTNLLPLLLLGFTSAAGSLLLSKFIAQEVYESHIDRHDDPDNVTCLGSGCFSTTHAICAALSAVCIFTSLCTMATTRRIYNQARFHKN